MKEPYRSYRAVNTLGFGYKKQIFGSIVLNSGKYDNKYSKVKQSHYRPGQALRVSGG